MDIRCAFLFQPGIRKYLWFGSDEAAAIRRYKWWFSDFADERNLISTREIGERGSTAHALHVCLRLFAQKRVHKEASGDKLMLLLHFMASAGGRA